MANGPRLTYQLANSATTTRESSPQISEPDAIFAAINDVVTVFAANGLPTRANPAAIAAFGLNPVGLEPAVLIGRLFLRHPDGRPLTVAELPSTCALRGERVSGQRLVFTNIAGRELTMLVSAAPLLTAGEVSGAVVVWHDVTEHERLLAQLAAEVSRLPVAPKAIPAIELPPTPTRPQATAIDAVVIGVSTGGPQALKLVIPQLPADFPAAVAIVLHMPVGYTELYAQRLNDLSRLKVVEAREGDVMAPGKVILAPAGRHLTLRRETGGNVVAHLDARPFDTPHRPSVDVLFRSAAEVYGPRLLGVVMTGMGMDGKEGAAWIKARGGIIFTEAEETCVVYGMPRAVKEAGLSDRSVPLYSMVQAITETAMTS